MLRTMPVRLIAALAISLFPAAPSLAQDAGPRHKGVWFTIGGGYGSAAIKCDQCTTDHSGGAAGFMGFGTTLSEQLLVGVEADWWSRDDNGVWSSVGNVSAVGYAYPMRGSGLFLKGGIGGAGFHASGYGPNKDEYGFGFMAGAGYEIPVKSSFSLTPVASYQWGTFGDNPPLTGLTQDHFQFSIGVLIP